MDNTIKQVSDWTRALNADEKPPFFNFPQQFGATITGPPVIGYTPGRWERGARELRTVARRLVRLEARLFGDMAIYESEGHHGIVDGAAARLCDVGANTLRRTVRRIDAHAAALDKTPIYDPDWVRPKPKPLVWGESVPQYEIPQAAVGVDLKTGEWVTADGSRIGRAWRDPSSETQLKRELEKETIGNVP